MASTTAKQRIAQELNSNKRTLRGAICQLQNINYSCPSIAMAGIRLRLEEIERVLLLALQQRATKAGVKGNYAQYIPHEQTRDWKRWEKEASKKAEQST